MAGRVLTGISTVKIAGARNFLIGGGFELGPDIRLEVEFVHVGNHFPEGDETATLHEARHGMSIGLHMGARHVKCHVQRDTSYCPRRSWRLPGGEG